MNCELNEIFYHPFFQLIYFFFDELYFIDPDYEKAHLELSKSFKSIEDVKKDWLNRKHGKRTNQSVET